MKNLFCAISLVAAMTTVALYADGPQKLTRPTSMSVSIGGFGGPSYRVTLRPDGRIDYVTMSGGFTSPKTETITIPEDRWRQFRAALDTAGIWKWKPAYPNPQVKDGTQWKIDIAFQNTTLKSEGSNSYPSESGDPIKSTKMTKPFLGYLEAVQQLLGDKRQFR